VAAALAAAVGLSVAPVSPAPVAAAELDVETMASTTILPWSAVTGPLSGAARRRIPRDRVRVGAAAVGLVAITGLVWGVSGGSAATRNQAPDESQRMGMALQAPDCHVAYALRADSGRAFQADLNVTNRADKPAENWELTFDFPDDQKVAAGRSAAFEQEGSTVVVRPAAGPVRLEPGASALLRLSGTYAGSNSLPVHFELDGAPCDVQVQGLSVPPTAVPAAPTAARAEPAGARVSGSGGGAGAGKQRAERKGSGKHDPDKHRD
ncbi:MAG TPA: cellulose binding domain-containing protein, partial [Micromonosporaceae bacterium]